MIYDAIIGLEQRLLMEVGNMAIKSSEAGVETSLYFNKLKPARSRTP